MGYLTQKVVSAGDFVGRQWPPMARGPTIYPESPEAIAKRLRALRGALGLTQASMARMVGSATSGQLWANFESRDPALWRRIGLNSALELCRRTGVTLEWIYRGDVRLLPPDLAERIRFQELLEDRGN